MITIKHISVENYRSIVGRTLEFSPTRYNVVVGPNNSGKSNILRACQLFFNGSIDAQPYSVSLDFPKTPHLPSRAQTRITLSLQYEPNKDVRIERAIANLEAESGQTRLAPDLIRLRLEYTRQGSPQWRFVSSAGLRSIRADLIQGVVDAVRASVRFKYLPVGRDIQETIASELSEELIRTVFSGWSGAVSARQQINEAIEVLLKRLQPRLATSGQEITDAIHPVFDEIKRLELRLPFQDLESMLPSLVPSLKDSYETGLKSKGAGIQTSTLLFLLKYLADHHPQRHHLRVTYVWAVEEPESYLHPSRQRAMSAVLQAFSKDVQTFITTHSPHFVPRSKNACVLIIDKEKNLPHSTQIQGNDYQLARQLLGVSLLDSMYLYPLNVIVEGPSDEILLRGAWAKLYEAGKARVDPSDIRFFPGGNASGACTLFESLIIFGSSSEVTLALVVDGDEAGQKALRGLLARAQNTRLLKANKDYFQLERNLEWLTSARVIELVENERPTQVRVTRNTKREITSFLILDGFKKAVTKRIVELSALDDLDEYQQLIAQIEKQATA